MTRHWVMRALKFLVFAVAAIAVLGWIAMSLWNRLMPGIFGWKFIDFWQAVGLVILCKILFGGWRGYPGRRMYWRHRMMERWGQMTPEERDRFREGMRMRFGRCGEPPSPKPTA
ncbi:MAG: hypothetical protein WA532_02710 [Candidatus Korobacteraceae bacterium]